MNTGSYKGIIKQYMFFQLIIAYSCKIFSLHTSLLLLLFHIECF
jgi:hypothetical protein